MISDFEQKVKEYWKNTPAVVIVKEIKRRTELPKWEDCPKNHIYVGVSRGKNKDKVTVVKHQMDIVLALRCAVEELRPLEHTYLGIVPFYADMTCVQCGEFSTRINTGHICQDCNERGKKK